jgi:hypothetical protein
MLGGIIMKITKLMETATMMKSTDYQERFKAEYYQLAIRADGLDEMLKKYKSGKLTFTPKCDYELLYEQLVYMRQYQRILECRAEIENVGLEE